MWSYISVISSIYDEKTAKEECIKMVRNIMEYWKAEAARIEQEQIL